MLHFGDFAFMDIEKIYAIYRENPLVDTDTRQLRKGGIYVALKGPSFNGNAFAEEALKKGSAYAIVDEEEFATHPRTILVDNCLECLQELANFHRTKLKIPVIALTGSNGKTTTKELISRVLSKMYNVLATKGNLNNHIGVPLTILSIDKEHEIAVIEMGANHQKEIEFLCAIAQPTYGIVTNIGKAHLEGFGGFEGVIKAKSEMYDFIRSKSGKIFLNADDSLLQQQGKGIHCITYGTGDNCDCTGKLLNEFPFLSFSYQWNEEQATATIIHSKITGVYNLANLLCAVAVGKYFGLQDKQIVDALESYEPENSRSQIVRKGELTIILDAYNANPSSMKAALTNFSKLEGAEKTMILGDMFELGSESPSEHEAIIKLADSIADCTCIFIGKEFHSFSGQNENKRRIYFQDFDSFKSNSSVIPKSGKLLIKGSRGMKLERVLELL
jgi:UDP-N-acetylmuramoyl-tripeptide--D-alanyl-D-alanine ligase